jgi:hypothetical protein
MRCIALRCILRCGVCCAGPTRRVEVHRQRLRVLERRCMGTDTGMCTGTSGRRSRLLGWCGIYMRHDTRYSHNAGKQAAHRQQEQGLLC